MNHKKIILKVLAGIVAIALIGGMLFITNSFVGNPISAMIASKAIQEYINQNYSNLDLEPGKTNYNFKDGSYMAFVKSQASIDTRFAIYFFDGQVQRDNYELYVLGMSNTLERLAEEYSAVAKKIIADELGYTKNTTVVRYDKGEYENINSILALDMKFDRSLPINAEVTIRLELQDNSLEGIAEILIAAHQAFVDNGCYFRKYGLYADNEGLLVMVSEVTPQDIMGGELVQLMGRAQNSNSVSGLSVFIKDGKL